MEPQLHSRDRLDSYDNENTRAESAMFGCRSGDPDDSPAC